ncbi:hypothetical protein G9A89_020651 [Geosiphon pyriformis]|nr:hypothetical protein G9A89_020651 [Geosiphon pyriformis]
MLLCQKLVPCVVVASGEKLLSVAAATGTATFVVPPGAVAADMELDLGGSPKIATPVLSAVPSIPNTTVESRLASLESHFSELSVLIKSLVESVSALVALVTKLLSIPSVMVVKKCKWACLDDNDNDVMSWSNKLTDSKREQNCKVMEIIKKNFNFKERIE